MIVETYMHLSLGKILIYVERGDDEVDFLLYANRESTIHDLQLIGKRICRTYVHTASRWRWECY